MDIIGELASRLGGKEIIKEGDILTLFRGQTIIFGRSPWDDDARVDSLARERNWGMVRKVGFIAPEEQKGNLEFMSRVVVAITLTPDGRLSFEALSGSNDLTLWDQRQGTGDWEMNPVMSGVPQTARKRATVDIKLAKGVKVRIKNKTEERDLVDSTLKSLTYSVEMNPVSNPGQ